jgi:hypothetical protein
MAKVRLVFAFFVVFSVFGGLIRPAGPVFAQDADAKSVGFVSGQWRVVAHAATVVESDSALGLTAGSEPWVIVIADITNIGTSVAPLTLANVELMADEEPLTFSSTSTVEAHKALKYTAPDASGSVSLREDETQRFALVYEGAEDLNVEDVDIGFDEEFVPLQSTAAEKLSIKDLPTVTSWSVTQAVLDRDEVQSVILPPTDGCYGAEVDAELQRLTGGSVWNENGGELTWYWDAEQGHLVPLQATLTDTGFAEGKVDSKSTFGLWLTRKSFDASKAKTGLWSLCKNAAGTWINEPTQAPPSAEEIRAEYTWVDTRELVTRPFVFEGEKIAVSGSVFTIQAEPGFTGMQIWVDTPNGQEAVVIAFEGDLPGVYEGTWVTVYGIGAGTFEGTNGFGATIVQPLIFADIVDY